MLRWRLAVKITLRAERLILNSALQQQDASYWCLTKKFS
jgi:hypothetical protein